MRLFLDSSILFSVCHSSTGGARELIRLAIKGKVDLFVSDYVFAETEMNLADIASRGMSAFLYPGSATSGTWLTPQATR